MIMIMCDLCSPVHFYVSHLLRAFYSPIHFDLSHLLRAFYSLIPFDVSHFLSHMYMVCVSVSTPPQNVCQIEVYTSSNTHTHARRIVNHHAVNKMVFTRFLSRQGLQSETTQGIINGRCRERERERARALVVVLPRQAASQPASQPGRQAGRQGGTEGGRSHRA